MGEYQTWGRIMVKLFFWTVLLLSTVFLVNCSSDDDGTTAPPTESVDNYLTSLPSWTEFSPPLSDTEGEVGPTEANLEFLEDAPYVCQVTPCSITATPEKIVTFNPNSEILYLGSLIQGQTYLGGLAAMEELPIRQRAPLTITIDIQFPDNSRTVDDPTVATVNQAVAELISTASDAGHVAGSALVYEEQTCHTLEQSMLKMGMSAHYLGASVSSQLQFDETLETHTIMAYFSQRMFTASMVLPQTPGALFSDAFNSDLLTEQIDLGRIGPSNLPVYVSNIVYGRIMIMTMTSTYSSSEMRAALEASYNQGLGGGTIDAEYETLLQSENTSFNIVAVGGEAQHAMDAITSGNLHDYFNSDAALGTAFPLSYTLRNLGDNSIAMVSETTTYNISECSDQIVTIYDDYDLWHTALMGMEGVEVMLQETGGTELLDADEIDTVPGTDQSIGRDLTFAGANTGLPFDFELNSLNASFNYNDDEFSSSFFPMLSVGNVGSPDYPNDDFEIVIGPANMGSEILAAGIWVGDSQHESGEFLRVYGEDGILLQELTADLPHGGGYEFMGVISPVPLTRLYYNEHSGGDDICIRHPHFGVKNTSP